MVIQNNHLIMIIKTNQNVKYLIYNVLQRVIFCNINKARKNFIISILWHILSIEGRINLLPLGRYSSLHMKTFG